MTKRIRPICLVLAMILSIFPMSRGRLVQAAGYDVSSPRTGSDGITTWDCVYFGNYWQNDTNGDGVADKKDEKQPVKWRVLSVDGNTAFLLADQNLDYQPYDEYEEYRDKITWEICTLRQWLNGDFYRNAFDAEEQKAVAAAEVTNDDNPFFGTEGGNSTNDRLYLLSLGEVWNPSYGFSEQDAASETREAKDTDYAKACGSDGEWWLRTPGGLTYFASIVTRSGDLGYFGDAVGTLHLSGVAESKCAVRPALHLNLASNAWRKADPVSATLAKRKESSETNGSDTGDTTKNPSGGTDADKKQQEKGNTVTTPKNNTYTPGTKTGIAPPGKAVLRSAKNKKGRKITLSWKKVKGAGGYQIQYADNKKFSRKKSRRTGKTKYTIKNLKKKKTYYIRVRAYKSDGAAKVYGKWSKVKKVKVKK